MIEIQIKNLLLFHVMTNGIITGCDITNHSPDYLLELFNRYIGIKISNNKKYPDLQKDEIFIKYKKIWGRHCNFSDVSDNLYWFIVRTHMSRKKGDINQHLKILIESFSDNIGELSGIKKDTQHTHVNLIKSIDKVFNRIDKDILRDIKLNIVLS
jgi:hypothetical protein